MSNFALEIIDQVRGKQTFQELVIDGDGQLTTFVDSLEACYKSEMDGIFNYMNQVANQKLVPKQKFHSLSDGKDGYKEYEFKSKHLRIYTIEYPNGKVVIFGGTKNNQPDDLRTFRALKKQFLSKTIKNEK